MFSTIKSRIMSIYTIILLISILTSLLIGITISKQYIQRIISQNMVVIYQVNTGEELGSIVDGDLFSQDRLINQINIDDKLSNVSHSLFFTTIFITTFCLISFFTIISNLVYNKFLKNIITIENENVDDFNQVKQLVDTQNSLIVNTNHDIEKINSYINHELKNSLAVLRTKTMNSQEFDDYIEELNKSIDDINALTTNQITNKYPVDLLLLVAQVIDNYRYYNIKFDFIGDNFKIHGNSTLLTRAIDNIINNAYKYGADKLVIQIYNLEESIIIKFTNNGLMIPRKELDKIFDYKYRTPELNKDGSGIGLALVRNIVELHSGGVFVESKQNVTSFYLTFKIINTQ